ncbi:ChaN family lipoprotein [Thalassovita sp.]|uniref:ChaN family lipoprotein n=1 Tax=Thalassovita sp. TaxID=1979401 RepID=UPI002AB0934E|nr:ChaN family lipoprotein [Thalassovita sp.]
MRMLIAAVLATFAAPPLHADEAADALFTVADIALLGEVHDNPDHHLEQARIVTAMQPAALVFEMLTPAQVTAAEGVDRQDLAALAEALGWADSGWPDFQIYAPVFAAAPMAQLYGAGLPRAEARAAYSNGISESFGAFSEAYGLTKDLPPDQMQARLTLQFQAHCEAIPRENLTPMVALQRLRDAYLARAAMQALLETGGPVAVITGNGHARSDWGATALIRQLDAEVKVIALGQSEDGQTPDGGFDLIIDSPGVDRGDPCDAFR